MISGRATQGFVLGAALVFIAFGLLCTPENLQRLGLMVNALNHESELVRKGARIEIRGAGAISFVIGSFLLILAPFWNRIRGSAQFRRFMARERPILRHHIQYRRKILTPTLAVMLVGFAVVFAYMVLADHLLTPEQMLLIQREDGIIESGSALLLLCAAAVSARIAFRLGRGQPEFYMHLFLAFLFFVMCGEEISWGQRFLGVETPDFLTAVNYQNEINFHNVYGFVFDHIFVLCFFLWGVVVPLLDRYVQFFRQFFAAIGLPVPSAGLAVAMLGVSATQSEIVHLFIEPFSPDLPRLRVPEPRELLSALAFLLLMLEVWYLVGRRIGAPGRERNREAGLGAAGNANVARRS